MTYIKRKKEPDYNEFGLYLKRHIEEKKLRYCDIDRLLGVKTISKYCRGIAIPTLELWPKLKKILNLDDTYDKIMTETEECDKKFRSATCFTKWFEPSYTLTTRYPPIHINNKRRLSIREVAILQNYPDNFLFFGSVSSMMQQIGNSVPVKLAKAIAEELIKELKILECIKSRLTHPVLIPSN